MREQRNRIPCSMAREGKWGTALMKQFLLKVCQAIRSSFQIDQRGGSYVLPLLQRLNYRVRWLLFSCRHPIETASWFELVTGADMQRFWLIKFPLTCKPAREYMSSRWSSCERIRCLTETYQVIRDNKCLSTALASKSGRVLASITLPSIGEINIRLGQDSRFRKEGELALAVSVPELGGKLTTAAMSFRRQDDGSLRCYIGAVQGKEGPDAIHAVTKAMHGLRPKALMVFVAQEVARCLGVDMLFGVGTRIQMHRKRYLLYLPSLHGVTFDYDGFWTELGGSFQGDGWFQLPLVAQQRDRSEIKPNKRSLYAKRYAMMDDLSQQLSHAILNSDFADQDQSQSFPMTESKSAIASMNVTNSLRNYPSMAPIDRPDWKAT